MDINCKIATGPSGVRVPYIGALLQTCLEWPATMGAILLLGKSVNILAFIVKTLDVDSNTHLEPAEGVLGGEVDRRVLVDEAAPRAPEGL